MLCAVCDRLDLIENATPKNWRDRFARLDKWFQENRPYILWDNEKSCIRIDETAKESGSPTSRTSRSIPELKPTWQSREVLKQPVAPEVEEPQVSTNRLPTPYSAPRRAWPSRAELAQRLNYNWNFTRGPWLGRKAQRVI